MTDKTWPHGHFCWLEHGTQDMAAAKQFYGEILGLTTKEMPMPGGMPGVYTMFTIGKDELGGIHALMDDEKAMGVPPHWMPYVAVDDIKATAGHADRLGGKLLQDVMDIPDVGQMAVLQDPAGATFALWSRHGNHKGATRYEGNDLPNGARCWTELMTTDVDRAMGFYGELLGWGIKKGGPEMGMPYTMFTVGDKEVAGMMQIQKEWGPVPPHWLNYFMVADTDATAKKVAAAGGKQPMPAMDIPNIGRIAMFMDPQGAAFAVLASPKS